MAKRNPAIIVDIDGTLADNTHRQHYLNETPKNWDAFLAGVDGDTLRPSVADIVHRLSHTYEVIYVTGRSVDAFKKTLTWLRVNMLPQGCVFMRQRGDFRPDHEVKKEIYDKCIKGFYDVHLVLDDRTSVVKMWREECGLECWQVASGDF